MRRLIYSAPSAPLPPISEHLRIHRRRSRRSTRPSNIHNLVTTQRQSGAPVPPQHPHPPCSKWMYLGSGDSGSDVIPLRAGCGCGSRDVRGRVKIDDGDIGTPPQLSYRNNISDWHRRRPCLHSSWASAIDDPGRAH